MVAVAMYEMNTPRPLCKTSGTSYNFHYSLQSKYALSLYSFFEMCCCVTGLTLTAVDLLFTDVAEKGVG